MPIKKRPPSAQKTGRTLKIPEVPTEGFKSVSPTRWQRWSAEQRAYVLAYEGKRLDERDAKSQTWSFGDARPTYGEICPKCRFDYCFYAMPRNWSVSFTADVVNYMLCGNVMCQHRFSVES